MSVASAAVVALAAVTATVAGLSVWARRRHARGLSFFRCRIGPGARRWRRRPARWRLGRARAAWAGTVLFVQSRPLPLWLTPVPARVRRGVTLRRLDPREARGLGPRPVALQLTADDGTEFEVAVAAECADSVVGPFLTAALPQRPPAPREPGP